MRPVARVFCGHKSRWSAPVPSIARLSDATKQPNVYPHYNAPHFYTYRNRKRTAAAAAVCRFFYFFFKCRFFFFPEQKPDGRIARPVDQHIPPRSFASILGFFFFSNAKSNLPGPRQWFRFGCCCSISFGSIFSISACKIWRSIRGTGNGNGKRKCRGFFSFFISRVLVASTAIFRTSASPFQLIGNASIPHPMSHSRASARQLSRISKTHIFNFPFLFRNHLREMERQFLSSPGRK